MSISDYVLFESNVTDIRFGVIDIYYHQNNQEDNIFCKTSQSSTAESHKKRLQLADERLNLTCPYLLQMIQVECDDKFWILRSFFNYPNYDLRSRSNELKTNTNELLKFIHDVLSATAFLESNQLIHGDIRSEFIYFDENVNRYILVDRLGSVTEMNVAQYENIHQDQFLYMSPILFEELCKNVLEVEHNPFKSEVFSIGMLILDFYAQEETLQGIYNKSTGEFEKNIFHKVLNDVKSTVFADSETKMIGDFISDILLNLSEKDRKTSISALKIFRETLWKTYYKPEFVMNKSKDEEIEGRIIKKLEPKISQPKFEGVITNDSFDRGLKNSQSQKKEVIFVKNLDENILKDLDIENQEEWKKPNRETAELRKQIHSSNDEIPKEQNLNNKLNEKKIILQNENQSTDFNFTNQNIDFINFDKIEMQEVDFLENNISIPEKLSHKVEKTHEETLKIENEEIFENEKKNEKYIEEEKPNFGRIDIEEKIVEGIGCVPTEELSKKNNENLRRDSLNSLKNQSAVNMKKIILKVTNKSTQNLGENENDKIKQDQVGQNDFSNLDFLSKTLSVENLNKLTRNSDVGQRENNKLSHQSIDKVIEIEYEPIKKETKQSQNESMQNRNQEKSIKKSSRKNTNEVIQNAKNRVKMNSDLNQNNEKKLASESLKKEQNESAQKIQSVVLKKKDSLIKNLTSNDKLDNELSRSNSSISKKNVNEIVREALKKVSLENGKKMALETNPETEQVKFGSFRSKNQLLNNAVQKIEQKSPIISNQQTSSEIYLPHDIQNTKTDFPIPVISNSNLVANLLSSVILNEKNKEPNVNVSFFPKQSKQIAEPEFKTASSTVKKVHFVNANLSYTTNHLLNLSSFSNAHGSPNNISTVFRSSQTFTVTNSDNYGKLNENPLFPIINSPVVYPSRPNFRPAQSFLEPENQSSNFINLNSSQITKTQLIKKFSIEGKIDQPIAKTLNGTNSDIYGKNSQLRAEEKILEVNGKKLYLSRVENGVSIYRYMNE